MPGWGAKLERMVGRYVHLLILSAIIIAKVNLELNAKKKKCFFSSKGPYSPGVNLPDIEKY